MQKLSTAEAVKVITVSESTLRRDLKSGKLFIHYRQEQQKANRCFRTRKGLRSTDNQREPKERH